MRQFEGKFESKYKVVENIGRNTQKMTAIIKDHHNKYYIGKKIAATDENTLHQIKLVKTLKHPNIIGFHEIIQEQDWIYIVEEYCEEGELQYHIKRMSKNKTHFIEATIARWSLQILLALQYLHHHKIVHRDIRPRNIFLTASGNIKVGSFKTSKILESEMTYIHTFLNSPYYMTPQLLEGDKYDEKIDIWAFGCVLYEICTLKCNFISKTFSELIDKVVKGKVQDLSPLYSRSLNQIFQSCLKKDPNKRASAKDLLKYLYYIEAMKNLIIEKDINMTSHQRFPIKYYKIHRAKLEKSKLKKAIFKQKRSVDKKQNGLPKIQVQSNKIQRKLSSRDKTFTIETPNIRIKNNSLQKNTSEKVKNSSLEKRNYNISKESLKTEALIRNYQEQKRQNEQKLKKIKNGPPLLPKPTKAQQSVRIHMNKKVKTKESEIQIDHSFQMTVPKKQLSRQLRKFKTDGLPEVSEGLAKIFQNLNIQQDEEFEFDLADQSQLRLTNKSNEGAELLKTYKSKLQQLIQEINYKYSPDLEPISQKTTEFDASILSQIRDNKFIGN